MDVWYWYSIDHLNCQGTLVSLKSKPLLRQADTSPVIPTRTNSVFKMMKAIGVSD